MLTQRARDQKGGLTGRLRHGLSRLAERSLEAAMLRAKASSSPTTSKSWPPQRGPGGNRAWGSQQAELRGEGKYDGVFGVWYGKGPASTAPATFSPCNHAGTSKPAACWR